MWPFDKVVVAPEPPAVAVDPAAAIDYVTPEPQPLKEEVVVPEFGAQAHGLVQCGDTWINFNEVSVLEFGPEDGCGAECCFKGADEPFHFRSADAEAMKAYLKGMASAGRSIEESTK